MRRTTTRFSVLLSLIPILLFACAPSMSEEEAKALLEKLEYMQIPIDPPVPGAQASDARNYYLILDGSGSMCEPPTNCKGEKRTEFARKMDGAKWAMEEFLKKVPPKDNLALMVFDNDGWREVVALGANNRDQLLTAIRAVDCGGGTPLSETMHHGTDQLVKQYQLQLGLGEYNLVIVTDGEAGGIPEAVVYARERSIQIHTVGLCIGENHTLRHFSMTYRAADSFQDMARGLEILVEEPMYYQLATPTPNEK